MTRRSICGGDSGVVNLVLGSFIVSCMGIRTCFSYGLLMSHPLSDQCSVHLQLVFDDKCLSGGAECVFIKKLRDRVAIPEMHSLLLVNRVGKTDPCVPLDTLDHAAGQGSSPARPTQSQNMISYHPASDSRI
jgi:hypothetical protein